MFTNMCHINYLSNAYVFPLIFFFFEYKGGSIIYWHKIFTLKSLSHPTAIFQSSDASLADCILLLQPKSKVLFPFSSTLNGSRWALSNAINPEVLSFCVLGKGQKWRETWKDYKWETSHKILCLKQRLLHKPKFCLEIGFLWKNTWWGNAGRFQKWLMDNLWLLVEKRGFFGIL